MLDEEKDTFPVYLEVTIPSIPQPLKAYSIDERLKYITDLGARKMAEEFLKEIKEWDETKVLIEPIKYDISLRKLGRVFAYVAPRRRYFLVYTHDSGGTWAGHQVRDKEELESITTLMRSNFDKL